MKKILLVIAILSFGYGWFAPCQAAFYPIEVEKICKGVEETDNRDERLQCLKEQINYLKTLLQETLSQVLDVSKNKKKLEKEQKEFIEGINNVLSDPKNADPAWRLTTYEAVKAYITVRIYELAASVLPKSKYSKEIRTLCSKAQTTQEGTDCAKMQFEADEKTMQANFAKALAKSKNKEELQTEQQKWAENRAEVCAFGAVFGMSGELYELECQDNWTRLRNADLIKIVNKRQN